MTVHVASSDARLRAAIRVELRCDARLASALLEAHVHGGVVTLRGSVANSGARWAAEEAVRRVEGVRRVVNELAVRPPSLAGT